MSLEFNSFVSPKVGIRISTSTGYDWSLLSPAPLGYLGRVLEQYMSSISKGYILLSWDRQDFWSKVTKVQVKQTYDVYWEELRY